MTEHDSLIVLNAVEGLTNRRVLKLIEVFGSAQNVLKASEIQLCNTGILLQKDIDELKSFKAEQFLDQEYQKIRTSNVKVCTYLDLSYPELLRQIADAPIVLYFDGNLDVLNRRSIALVGSRRASIYGLTTARDFGLRLAQAGLNIVSGLARGIDGAAHQGALTAKGITVAVLGCGLSHQYPREHQGLREKIKINGAVVSEFPMSVLPYPYNFPRRNRIISGLSQSVVIIEAAKKSGALITADFALEQNRDVYAVPGKIDNTYAEGVNDLIKQGAMMVTTVEDIIKDQNINISINTDLKSDNTLMLSDVERMLLNSIQKIPRHFDTLIEEAQLDTATVNRTLCQLELKKIVKQLPGKYFVR